jgi:integrase
MILCVVDGRRYRLRGYQTRSGKLVPFQDESAAREALGEIRSDIRRGVDPLQAITDFLPLGATHSTVEHHYKAFCKAKASDPSVKLSRQRIIHLWGHLERGHLDEIKDLPVQTLSYADLDDWVRALFERTELGANSVHHIVTDFRTFLRWCARRSVIKAAPEVPAVRVPEYVPNVPSAQVQERVLDAIEWRSRGVFLARGLLGLRPSEARDANLGDYWFDPDGSRDVLTVRKSKSNRYRLLPVPAPLATWVREHRPTGNLHDADAAPVPLFDNPIGHGDRRWHQSSERRVLLAAMKACGVSHKPNELLRHAFGTEVANRLLGEGSGSGDVSRLLMATMGHTEVKTSNRYVRLATEGLERIVSRGEGDKS